MRDVADRSPDLSAAAISRAERGLVSPSLHQLDAWAAALGARLDVDLLRIREAR